MCTFNDPVECCIEPRREKPCFVVPAKNKIKIICASMQADQRFFLQRGTYIFQNSS